MLDDLQKLTVQIEADIARLEQNLRQANRIIDGKLDNIDRRVNRSEKRFSQWGRNVARSIQVGMVAAVAYAGKEALATADRVDVLQDRIKDATRASGDFDRVWKGISKTALETGSKLQNNVELVQRLSTAAEDLGATNDDILRVNETVQKLGIISGASASSLAAGTTQLAQGLSNNILRAEEWNSVLENTQGIANAIAASLGKSTSELGNMVRAGQVTSKQVFDALLASSKDVDKRFGEIPPRLERAWSSVLTAISLRIDGVNEQLSITESLAKGLEGFAGFMTPDSEEVALLETINRLYERRSNLAKNWNTAREGSIARDAATRQLDTLDEQIDQLEARLDKIRNPGKNENKKVDAPDPRATPDYIQPSIGDLKKDRPDNPNQVAIDRGAEINRQIAERTSLVALEGVQIGKTEAQIARMNLEYEINKRLSQDRVKLTAEQRDAMQIQLDLYQQELELNQSITDEIKRREANMEKLEQASEQFADDMGRALVDSIVDGENALSSLTKAFKAAMIRMAADALIINPLKQLFSPSGGNLFGNIFGGFFADGGNPPVGKMSVVGERGPELFIPKTAGTIVSNDNFGKMMGGNIKVINQTTGRIDSVQKTMTRGEVQLILREELPGAMAGQVASPNSSFNKTFRAHNSVSRKF